AVCCLLRLRFQERIHIVHGKTSPSRMFEFSGHIDRRIERPVGRLVGGRKRPYRNYLSTSFLGAARPRPTRPGGAPAAGSEPGPRGRALTTAAVTPENRHQAERRSPWPWKLFPLDFESLMTVRRLRTS